MLWWLYSVVWNNHFVINQHQLRWGGGSWVANTCREYRTNIFTKLEQIQCLCSSLSHNGEANLLSHRSKSRWEGHSCCPKLSKASFEYVIIIGRRLELGFFHIEYDSLILKTHFTRWWRGLKMHFPSLHSWFRCSVWYYLQCSSSLNHKVKQRVKKHFFFLSKCGSTHV